MADDGNYTSKIPKLRETFAELFAGNLNSNVYDERDIERLRLDDENARGYLRHQKGNVEKAATMIDACLKWRREMEINDLDDKSFPREMHEMGAVYWHSHDNKGHKILYFCIKKNKKDPERLPLVKKFVAWHIEKHYKKNPDQKLVALLDMTDAGFGNMDMDLIKFQISCFTTYFPGMLAYMLIYEMPWVLNAIWKVIKTLLSAEQQKAVIFVKRSEVQNYIEPEKLWKHMGGTDNYVYTYIPSEDSGIELNNGEMATPTEDEEFSLAAELLESSAAAKKRVTFSESDPVVYTSFDRDSLDEVDGKCLSNNNNKSLNIAQRRASEEDNVFVSSILTISPAEELEFCTADESRDSLDIISLTNTTEKHVAYKVKTTSPEKYRVRPSTGVIQPNGHADIHVYLHAGQSGVAKDKFLIMFMDVEPEVTVSQVNELFKVTSRENYSEHRLRCKLGLTKVSAESSTPSGTKSSMSDQINKLTHQCACLSTIHHRPHVAEVQDEDGKHVDFDYNVLYHLEERDNDSGSEAILCGPACRFREVDYSEASVMPLLSSDAMMRGKSATEEEIWYSFHNQPSQIKSQLSKMTESDLIRTPSSSGDSDIDLGWVMDDDYTEMETLLSSQQRLESQLGRVKLFVTMLLVVIVMLIITVVLTYWLQYLPVNKYTVNACLPHHL